MLIRTRTVKRAIRALESPAYEKARTKNALLPPVTNREEAENCFKLLPLSLLALRVQKIDPNAGHEGHNHAPPDPKKRVKGLWNVSIVQQQDAGDDMHYMWLWEGPQWKKKLYAGGALAGIMTVVMFPLWPLVMRQGVWYLSMGCLGLLGLFFVMAIVRLILFAVTMFTHPPGLWLYPNLFEDVGFFDSFRPVWAWHEVSFCPSHLSLYQGQVPRTNESRIQRRSASSAAKSEPLKRRRPVSRPVQRTVTNTNTVRDATTTTATSTSMITSMNMVTARSSSRKMAPRRLRRGVALCKDGRSTRLWRSRARMSRSLLDICEIFVPCMCDWKRRFSYLYLY